MAETRTVRAVLLVVGVGLVVLGGVGPGPVGVVSVLGIVTLLAAVVLAAPIADRLGTDEPAEAGSDDPVETLREQYVSGELDEAAFERRMEQVLAAGDDRSGSGLDAESETDSSLTREQSRE